MEEQSGKKKEAKIKEKEFESLNVRTHEYCVYIDFRAILRKSCLCYNGIVALINSFFLTFCLCTSLQLDSLEEIFHPNQVKPSGYWSMNICLTGDRRYCWKNKWLMQKKGLENVHIGGKDLRKLKKENKL